MAPLTYPMVNGSLTSDPYHPSYSFTSSPSSSSSETITNTVFGLCAVAIGVVSIWQGRRAWKIWHAFDEGCPTAQNHGMPFTPRMKQSYRPLTLPDDGVNPDLALELRDSPLTHTEQAQLSSEPAPPYTAGSQSSPKIEEPPYGSYNPPDLLTLQESAGTLPITFAPTSSVESSLKTAPVSRTAAAGGLPSINFESSGGPPAP